jgi:L-amino acid N-acyltransferase YncA
MQPANAAALEGLRFLWLDAVDAQQAVRLAQLLNRVLEIDDTVGFPGPIPHEQALRVVADLDAAVRAGRSHLLLVENDERAVAQCVLVPSGSPNNRHVGWIFRTMVDPEMRQAGVVRLGMAHLAERCEALGIDVLCIDVRAGTPAEMIWRHLGFQVIGTLPDYARVRGKSHEGLYMYQTVTELKKHCAALPRVTRRHGE